MEVEEVRGGLTSMVAIRRSIPRIKPGHWSGRQRVFISVPEEVDSSRNMITPRKPLITADVDVHAGANQLDFDLAD